MMDDFNELEKELKANRNDILFIELAGLLHDVGKLSEEFLKYRQTWQGDPKGYWNDPHDHEYLDNHEVFKDLIPNAFNNKIGNNVFGKNDFSITKAVHEHIDPKEDNLICRMLKAADGIDAAIDRNNPLFSAEQKEEIFQSNIFGYENKKVDFNEQEKAREDLYSSLNKLLPLYLKDYKSDKREDVFGEIEKAFIIGLADTTRPQNDTTLWEHSYSVASILKTLLAHKVIYGKTLDSFEKVRFGILGIGWDGLAYMSSAHKIGDITGRKKRIDDLKKCIKEAIEWEYALGNRIYADDNGIYFIIPSIPSEIDLDNTDFNDLGSYGQLLQNIQDEIANLALEITGGDITPKFHLIQDTKHITHLVRCIRGLRKKTAYPLLKHSLELSNKLNSVWSIKETVCPVCRRRPVVSEKKQLEVCEKCNEIRKDGRFFSSGDSIETPFVTEIARANTNKSLKRVALIVGRFGIEPWLDGKMIRSLFVAEANGMGKELEELGNTKSFERDEKDARQWLQNHFGNLIKKGYDYRRIKSEIDLCLNYGKLQDDEQKEYAENILFLYDRRIKYNRKTDKDELNKNPAGVHWEDFKEAAIKEYRLEEENADYLLYNILCSKTPTPSTILDVWNTTESFFSDLREDDSSKKELLGVGTEKRWRGEAEKPERAIIHALYEGRHGNASVEVVWVAKNDIWIIGDIDLKSGDVIYLDGKPFENAGKDISVQNPEQDVEYYPLRIITTTPDTFMAIVPADRAVEISKNMHEKYKKQFGKVIGRLPFSIGNIFFPEKTPMFVALDAGRRMVNSFDDLHGKEVYARVSKEHDNCSEGILIDEFAIQRCPPKNTGILWQKSKLLGDGSSTDYFHPYFIVNEDSKDFSHRKNYFKTVAGEVIHFNEVEPGDILKVYPNYYDFEFLDSNARRHDINLNDNYKRKSSATGIRAKPFFLDELEQKIICLWDDLLKGKKLTGITDTKLKNLQSLWLSKYDEWEVDIDVKDSDCYKQWITLVETSIIKEFKGVGGEKLTLLSETIENGIFFETLELYLGILKERIDKE